MKTPRRRRTPEAARGEILDAAERVLSTHAPDAVGLAEVAGAAGVSLALVSHYFGTYVGVVDAVLERRRAAVRVGVLARLAQADAPDVDELLAALFEALSDRAFVRLSLWALAAERPSASEAFPVGALGQAPSPAFDRGVRQALGAMLRAYVTPAAAPPPPTAATSARAPGRPHSTKSSSLP